MEILYKQNEDKIKNLMSKSGHSKDYKFRLGESLASKILDRVLCVFDVDSIYSEDSFDRIDKILEKTRFKFDLEDLYLKPYRKMVLNLTDENLFNDYQNLVSHRRKEISDEAKLDRKLRIKAMGEEIRRRENNRNKLPKF